MEWQTTAADLYDYLRSGDLDHCLRHVSDVIRARPDSPSHLVLEVDFTNDPAEVASHFDQFVTEQQGKLAAIYTETNGFFINFDLWYFDLFGYSRYGGRDDYDWLAAFETSYEHSIALTGMGSLQQAYKQVWDSKVYHILSYGGDPTVEQLKETNGLCDLLVVLRFQNLIQRSAALMQKVDVPVLATSHEYDFIYELTLRNIG